MLGTMAGGAADCQFCHRNIGIKSGLEEEGLFLVWMLLHVSLVRMLSHLHRLKTNLAKAWFHSCQPMIISRSSELRMAEAKGRTQTPATSSDMQSLRSAVKILRRKKDLEQTKQIEELQKQHEEMRDEKQRLLEEIERILSEPDKMIVGMAGIGGSLAVVALCGFCTFLTLVSLSEIATKGAMKVETHYFLLSLLPIGGGPYYLIGHALGPEVGVTIGLCFFQGNVIAGSMLPMLSTLISLLSESSRHFALESVATKGLLLI
ncbi:Amino acid permease domain-containing protein [Cynara cardunculus var. scolymus]|uniref:Amino acid permease domain-containing protein n=1 Tax=Cynara cardunculus var. scolymus TaxID=59895 RepID=A0A103Y312_CYNCS|nr:Amino acid permease domain-containing protein [Cynara cardunculus var. scolymus]